MKNTVVLLVIGIIVVLLGNARAECVRAQILEDISLPGQKSAEGFYNMMAIDEGLEAMCNSRPYRSGLFQEARDRLDAQRDLIPLLVADGELKPNQVRYYRGFFQDMQKNLNACEIQAIEQRRSGRVPQLKKLVELVIRPNDIVDIFYLFREGGAVRRHLISHKIWFGRIIEQDGFDLCQTTIR